MMTAYSIEFGKQYKYCIDCDRMYIFEPKAEFMYAHADAKSFSSNLGNHIRYGNTDSYSAKLSFMAGYKSKLESGKIVEPFIQAAYIKEFHGNTNIIFDGAQYRSYMKGESYEFGGGLNVQINKNVSFYSDVMYETGNVIQSVSGNIGMRYTW